MKSVQYYFSSGCLRTEPAIDVLDHIELVVWHAIVGYGYGYAEARFSSIAHRRL
jgi:hypothetical protein